MRLFELLPFLEGWEYAYKTMASFEYVQPGQTVTLWEASPPPVGWVVSAQAWLTDPDAIFTVEYDFLTADFAPRGMFEGGLTAPTPVSFWLSRYDDIEKAYVLQFSPSVPLPFSKKCEFRLTAPKDKTVGYMFNYVIIKVVELEKFMESLRRLIAGNETNQKAS